MKIVATHYEIEDAVLRMAGVIESDYGEQEVLCLAIMNGAAFFAVDLLRELPENFELGSIRVSSYAGQESTGKLHWHSELPDVQGKHVLLLDEICDSGLTLQAICAEVQRRGAASVKAAAFVNIKGKDKLYSPEYSGITFDESPGFLVGYGMDDNGKGRQDRNLYVV